MNSLLIKALKKNFDMSSEDAVALAKTVKHSFRGRKEVEDMSIDKYMRSVFYELHRSKILKLRREEIKEKGKAVRRFYWSFDDESIREAAYRKLIKEPPYKIYEKIPEEAWLIHSRNT